MTTSSVSVLSKPQPIAHDAQEQIANEAPSPKTVIIEPFILIGEKSEKAIMVTVALLIAAAITSIIFCGD